MFEATARKRDITSSTSLSGRKGCENFDVDAEYTLLSLMLVFQFTLLLASHATHVQLLEVF